VANSQIQHEDQEEKEEEAKLITEEPPSAPKDAPTAEGEKGGEGEKEEAVRYEDDMSGFLWDGPEDSDEEIAEMAGMKTEWEQAAGIKFSKRGIIEAIEKALREESPNNKEDPRTAKAWE